MVQANVGSAATQFRAAYMCTATNMYQKQSTPMASSLLLTPSSGTVSTLRFDFVTAAQARACAGPEAKSEGAKG
jgi:hypothetical protein